MDGERKAAASAAGRTDEVMCKGRISRPASVTSPGRRDVTRTSRPLSRRVHETSKTPCYSLLQLRSLATGDRWSDTPSATTPPLTRRRTSPGQLSASCITIIIIGKNVTVAHTLATSYVSQNALLQAGSAAAAASARKTTKYSTLSANHMLFP